MTALRKALTLLSHQQYRAGVVPYSRSMPLHLSQLRLVTTHPQGHVYTCVCINRWFPSATST
jgi:hypothetical protein